MNPNFFNSHCYFHSFDALLSNLTSLNYFFKPHKSFGISNVQKNLKLSRARKYNSGEFISPYNNSLRNLIQSIRPQSANSSILNCNWRIYSYAKNNILYTTRNQLVEKTIDELYLVAKRHYLQYMYSK